MTEPANSGGKCERLVGRSKNGATWGGRRGRRHMWGRRWASRNREDAMGGGGMREGVEEFREFLNRRATRKDAAMGEIRLGREGGGPLEA